MSPFYLNELHNINEASRGFFESIQNPWLTKWMIFVTDMGSPGSIALYCLMIVMGMWLHKKYTHMIQFILTLGGTALLAVATKELVKLPRPAGGIVFETGYSFASAHAMIAMVFFSLLIYSYKNHIHTKILRWMCVLCVCICVGIVGMSRVYLGVHYMTDVLAGFIGGLLVTAISIVIYEKYAKSHVVVHRKK
jgi:undecaprenyl-diphosphatase